MSFQQHHSNDGEGAPLLRAHGVHFQPTDEELMSDYLTQKVANSNYVFQAIGEVDFNKCEPWDLPPMAKEGDLGIFYFFSLWKYPAGMRTNRATPAGHWKCTGKDRKVITRRTGTLLGMKKTLVFYTGRAPKSRKTSWIMHEYCLQGESKSDQKQWVVCKVFERNVSKKMAAKTSNCNGGSNAKDSTFQPCSYLPAFPSLESPGSNFVKPNTLSEPSDYLPGGTSLANPEETSNCNGGFNAKDSTFQPRSYMPALSSLESPGSNFVEPNTLSEPSDYLPGGTSLANPEETSNCNAGFNAKDSTFQPCSYLLALPSLESPGSNFVNPNTLSEPSDYLPGGTSLANPEETSNCNGGFNANDSTFQPCSYLPALSSLESPGSNFVEPNTLSEPSDYLQGGTSLANPETTLKESNSTFKERLEEDLIDTVENLVSCWDMGSPVPLWDVDVGTSSDISGL